MVSVLILAMRHDRKAGLTQGLAERIGNGTSWRRIDIGRMNDRYFANGAGVGFDRPWKDDEPRAGKLVVIGEHDLDQPAIDKALAQLTPLAA